MQKHYLTQHEREISIILSRHLPGSPFNLSPSSVIVPKDLQDLERYPKSFTYHDETVDSFWRPTNWKTPPMIEWNPNSVRRFTFTKHNVRIISMSIMQWLMFGKGKIFTPLYKVESKRNIHDEKYVDITRSNSYPRTYESWLQLAEADCTSSSDNSSLRRNLLLYNNHLFTSLERSNNNINTSASNYWCRLTDPVQALPESLSFLFQLHLFLAMILNIGKVDDTVRVRTDIWKPVPYPEEDFQLFFYGKYRLSYLKERRTWRLWEI